MIWYQYLFLAIAVVCYSIKDLQIFGKLRWQSKWSRIGFWDRDSWVRKWSNIEMQIPKFWGSTTFLVFITDGFHLMQMLMKICFSIGIFGLTWKAGVAWLVWTALQWGCFKAFSK